MGERGYMAFQRPVSRRKLLQAMGGGALAVTAIPLLAACDASTTSTTTDSVTPDDTSDVADTDQDDADSQTDADDTDVGDDVVSGEVTVYSGRNQELVQPILDQFTEATGITVNARFGDTAELAAAILEEGQNSPADLYFGQDAGALGALAREGRLSALPETLLERVEPRFRSPDGVWVGISGRARAVVYNTDLVDESEIPDSILGFVDPQWDGRLGWAPTNGSFQSFITALRVIEGDDVARDWLEGINALNPRVFEGNTPIVRAAIAGEIAAGFVNHYYLHRERAEAGEPLPAENYIYQNGDPGALVNIAGAGILNVASSRAQAEVLIDYLLDVEAQTYFATETHEYPLVSGVEGNPDLVPIDDIDTPDVDLSDLADLEGTLAIMRDVGLL
jgi:iron(III) transport system substrate-binding protein